MTDDVLRCLCKRLLKLGAGLLLADDCSPRDTLESHNGGWIDAGTDALEAFVQHCGVTYVDECRDNKQVLLIYKSWLRKQPVPERKHGTPSVVVGGFAVAPGADLNVL